MVVARAVWSEQVQQAQQIQGVLLELVAGAEMEAQRDRQLLAETTLAVLAAVAAGVRLARVRQPRRTLAESELKVVVVVAADRP